MCSKLLFFSSPVDSADNEFDLIGAIGRDDSSDCEKRSYPGGAGGEESDWFSFDGWVSSFAGATGDDGEVGIDDEIVELPS